MMLMRPPADRCARPYDLHVWPVYAPLANGGRCIGVIGIDWPGESSIPYLLLQYS